MPEGERRRLGVCVKRVEQPAHLSEVGGGEVRATVRPRFGGIREHMRKQKRLRRLTDEQTKTFEKSRQARVG